MPSDGQHSGMVPSICLHLRRRQPLQVNKGEHVRDDALQCVKHPLPRPLPEQRHEKGSLPRNLRAGWGWEWELGVRGLAPGAVARTTNTVKQGGEAGGGTGAGQWSELRRWLATQQAAGRRAALP